MSQNRALSSDDVRTLQAELDGGGTPTVWFTSSAVGVQEGRSGKVIALDDGFEGDFIQVRPAGSKDVLSFSAGEVTLVKPPRKPKQPEAAAKAEPKPNPPATKSGTATKSAPPTESAAGETAKRTSSAQAKRTSPAATSQSGPSAERSGPAQRPDDAAKPRSAAGTQRKPRQRTGATVTLTADHTGQWSVEVSSGKKRVLRPRPVSAASVAQAASALHNDVAEAVEPLLAAAREDQQARVEQLQQELAEAQRMLDELG